MSGEARKKFWAVMRRDSLGDSFIFASDVRAQAERMAVDKAREDFWAEYWVMEAVGVWWTDHIVRKTLDLTGTCEEETT